MLCMGMFAMVNRMSIKQSLRTLLSPLLNILESGTEPYSYKPSHRIILIAMGSLFCGLAIAVYIFSQGADLGYLLPVIIFGTVGSVSLLIGFIGTDRAVAKMWGSR